MTQAPESPSAPIWTPGDVAVHDQMRAETAAELDRLALILRGLDRRGEQQADADLMAYLVRDHAPATLAALVVAALRRASREASP